MTPSERHPRPSGRSTRVRNEYEAPPPSRGECDGDASGFPPEHLKNRHSDGFLKELGRMDHTTAQRGL